MHAAESQCMLQSHNACCKVTMHAAESQCMLQSQNQNTVFADLWFQFKKQSARSLFSQKCGLRSVIPAAESEYQT